MKFAVDRSLAARKYDTADVGSSLERVMRYWTVRDRFHGVHPALERIGVTRIDVNRSGLLFVRDIEDPNNARRVESTINNAHPPPVKVGYNCFISCCNICSELKCKSVPQGT